jgi:hypothetical protein
MSILTPFLADQVRMGGGRLFLLFRSATPQPGVLAQGPTMVPLATEVVLSHVVHLPVPETVAQTTVVARCGIDS